MKYNFQIDMEANNSHTAILKKVKPQSKVLEFGPATGYMTEIMKNNLNCKIHAIEVDSDAAKVTAEYTEKMIVCDVDTLEWISEIKDEKFDYIIFADVLEHLKDPWRVLAEVTNNLNDLGQVLISIPNVAHNGVLIELLNDKFNYRKLGLLDNTHIRFFTKESVISLVEKSGLVITDIQKVIIPPEITELGVTYDSLPNEVSNFLRLRENGEVYQYIITAEKKVTSKIAVETSKEIYIASDYVEIFYDTGKGFNAIESQKLPIEKIGEEILYEFDITEKKLESLRIDPSNSPGIGTITEISIVKSGTQKAESILEQAESENKMKLIRMSDNRAILVSWNSDPQLIFKDFDKLYGSVEKLRIKLSFSKFYNENQISLINELSNYNDKLLKDMNNVYNEKLIEYETEIKNASISLKNREEESKLLLNRIQEFEALHVENLNRIQEFEALQEKNKIQIIEITKMKETLENEYHNLINSSSWKITEPLRKIKKFLK